MNLKINNSRGSTRTCCKGGFTLLEILLVVGIIAILTGIVILAINPARQLAQARNAERLSDIKQINNAIIQYYIDNNVYPSDVSTTSLTEICDTGTATSTEHTVDCTGLSDLSILVPTYVVSMPIDPQGPVTSFLDNLITKVFAATNGTGYYVMTEDNKVILTAPRAELGVTIAIGTTTVTVAGGEEIDYSCGDPTLEECWSTQVGEWNYAWSTENIDTPADSLTNGKANTAALFALPGNYPAADYCYNLTEGDVPVGTWYLPAKEELSAGWLDLGPGGFPSDDYWSSTEHSNSLEFAWDLVTYLDEMGGNGKSSQHSVRCLR